MRQFEIEIEVLNPDYIDSLIIALARQGHSPYYSDDGEFGKHGGIFFTVYEEKIKEIK
jgi:hypothetical protein